jgi:imidazolonepropionase-like amidohydrolase
VRSCLHSLAHGVTTVRDLGSLDSVNVIVRDLVDKEMIHGPRIYACGAAIAMTGGHGVPHSVEADGVDGVKTAVRNELKKGANVIKFMASGGGLLADRDLAHTAQLGLDELRAGVEEAHKAERRVAVHAHPKSAILASIEAGADTIEHAGLADQESAEAIARSGIYVIPTLTVTAMLDSVGAGHDLPGHARAKEIQAARRRSYRQVVEAGGKLAVGTDGYEDMGIEMRLMAEWGGLSNMDILIAATMGGARALGAADELGSIEVGKLADLILLEKDPRADLESTDNPLLVFKGGMRFDPSTLLAAVPEDRTV